MISSITAGGRSSGSRSRVDPLGIRSRTCDDAAVSGGVIEFDANSGAGRTHPRRPSPRVSKTVLAYGILGGVLIAVLKLVEYQYLVLEHSVEIYGGIVALIFSGLGIWLGLKLTRTRETVVVREVPVHIEVPVHVGGPFERNQARVEQLGITPRELEILEAMAAGCSNREIAERLFVSENTVKTHAGRLFDKLSARRRTQAVQHAKEAGLIP
jgi:DNA-binding CsgD family transcriptional regulator